MGYNCSSLSHPRQGSSHLASAWDTLAAPEGRPRNGANAINSISPLPRYFIRSRPEPDPDPLTKDSI